jgi:hypothetical protein
MGEAYDPGAITKTAELPVILQVQRQIDRKTYDVDRDGRNG